MADDLKQPNKMPAPIARTSAGLRDAIFDEIDSIRNGTSNPTRANAVAKLASGIVETVRMELEVHKALHRGTPAADTQDERSGGFLLNKPLPLGQPAPEQAQVN